jgi:hypothetical protein
LHTTGIPQHRATIEHLVQPDVTSHPLLYLAGPELEERNVIRALRATACGRKKCHEQER